MTIKVKVWGDKATVRFNNPAEGQWFRNQMVFLRDSNPKMHPQMIVRDEKGHVPQMPKPKPLGKTIVVPKPKLETFIENGTVVVKSGETNAVPTPPVVKSGEKVKHEGIVN